MLTISAVYQRNLVCNFNVVLIVLGRGKALTEMLVEFRCQQKLCNCYYHNFVHIISIFLLSKNCASVQIHHTQLVLRLKSLCLFFTIEINKNLKLNPIFD